MSCGGFDGFLPRRARFARVGLCRTDSCRFPTSLVTRDVHVAWPWTASIGTNWCSSSAT